MVGSPVVSSFVLNMAEYGGDSPVESTLVLSMSDSLVQSIGVQFCVECSWQSHGVQDTVGSPVQSSGVLPIQLAVQSSPVLGQDIVKSILVQSSPVL